MLFADSRLAGDARHRDDLRRQPYDFVLAGKAVHSIYTHKRVQVDESCYPAESRLRYGLTRTIITAFNKTTQNREMLIADPRLAGDTLYRDDPGRQPCGLLR